MTRTRQSDTTFEEINAIVWQHLEDRDWHELPSRALAISLALEANELLEHYQWNEEPVGSKEDIADELADIMIYAFEFAQQNDIDMASAIKSKLAKAAKKYPAEMFKGKQDDGQRDAWLEAKKNYKKTGL
jgi:NTP pyrophosphatase (non-canonical NTP hydrolase)